MSANEANNLAAYIQTIYPSDSDKAEMESIVKQFYDLIGGRDVSALKLSNNELTNAIGLLSNFYAKMGLELTYSVDRFLLVTTKGETMASFPFPLD